jgi:hypothetical protein
MDDEVIEALDLQVGFYRQLAKLAELQHVHVQQEQADALMEVLKIRQRIVEEITQLERVVGPARRNWDAYVARIDGDRRGRVELLVAESRRLLEEITRADQNDALVLQQRKLNVARQRDQAQAARHVNRTYAVAAYGNRAGRVDVQR